VRRNSASVGDCKPLLLRANDLADRLILDLPQCDGVDAARREVVALLQQPRRAEEAATVVGSEGDFVRRSVAVSCCIGGADATSRASLTTSARCESV